MQVSLYHVVEFVHRGIGQGAHPPSAFPFSGRSMDCSEDLKIDQASVLCLGDWTPQAQLTPRAAIIPELLMRAV